MRVRLVEQAAKRKLRRERAAAKKSSAKPHGVEVFDGVGSLLDRYLAFSIGKNRVALRYSSLNWVFAKSRATQLADRTARRAAS